MKGTFSVLLREIRNLASIIIREKIFNADFSYMEEQRNYIKSSQKKAFISFLNKYYPTLKISLLEIGSRYGLTSHWSPLLNLKNLHLEGIEPDKKEATALMKQKKIPYKKIYTETIYHKKDKINLFITNVLGCTSIYEPNMSELKYYPEHKDFVVRKKIKVNAKPLDLVIPKEKSFDFINMDVQGAEWNVIKGARRIFKNVIGVTLESHFFEYYKNEKLFSEVNNLMKKDFRLLKLITVLMGGELSHIEDAVYIKRHDLIKNREDLIKRILFSVLFNRKEHVEFLLRNYSGFLSYEENSKIIRIFNINLKELEEARKVFEVKDFVDGDGYSDKK